jgi:xanthine permease
MWKTGFLGLQHVLAMYAGAIVVPLIVGPAVGMNQQQLAYLISIDLFTCGIATLIQVIGGRHFGIRLPAVLGCTFTAVVPMISIGKMQGVTAIYGAIIASGIIVMILAQFFSKVVKWFPPVVTGSVVMLMGVSLIPVAMNNAAGGEGSPTYGQWENLLLAFVTFLMVILINRFFRGYVKAISVLIALVIGTGLAAIMGMVSFHPVMEADWFHMVQPLYFGVPTFHLSAILMMVLVSIVSMIESTGVFMALGEVCEKEVGPDDIKRGLRAEGLAIGIGGLFNAFPYTTFSQNVGLVALTRVKTRAVVIWAGGLLMLLGSLPKVAALTTIIPTPVLGGAMVPMFGMVVTSGVRMLSVVDFHRTENLLIIASSIGIGLGVAVVPHMFQHLPHVVRLLVENGIVMGSLTAVVLNWILNHTKGVKHDHPLEKERLLPLKEDRAADVTL